MIDISKDLIFSMWNGRDAIRNKFERHLLIYVDEKFGVLYNPINLRTRATIIGFVRPILDEGLSK